MSVAELQRRFGKRVRFTGFAAEFGVKRGYWTGRPVSIVRLDDVRFADTDTPAASSAFITLGKRAHGLGLQCKIAFTADVVHCDERYARRHAAYGVYVDGRQTEFRLGNASDFEFITPPNPDLPRWNANAPRPGRPKLRWGWRK